MFKWIKSLKKVVKEFSELKADFESYKAWADADLARLKDQDEYLSKRVDNLASYTTATGNRVERAEGFIRDRTDISVDTEQRGPCTVILTGKYKSNDYIEVIDVTGRDFSYLVELLQDMKPYHKSKAFDIPQSMRYIIKK